ncbi:hypothetical protein Dimus_031881 [Dionaea muscipula]
MGCPHMLLQWAIGWAAAQLHVDLLQLIRPLLEIAAALNLAELLRVGCIMGPVLGCCMLAIGAKLDNDIACWLTSNVGCNSWKLVGLLIGLLLHAKLMVATLSCHESIGWLQGQELSLPQVEEEVACPFDHPLPPFLAADACVLLITDRPPGCCAGIDVRLLMGCPHMLLQWAIGWAAAQLHVDLLQLIRPLLEIAAALNLAELLRVGCIMGPFWAVVCLQLVLS